MIFLNVEDIIDFHTEIINEFGGSHGIRDMGLLISAIEMPKASMFGEDLHPTIFDKAAAYLFHIVCNHAFIDGNKRSGIVAALTFLESNEIYLKYDEIELENLVIDIANGKVKKKEIALFFQNSLID
jgi:death-on-curing protein